MNAPEAAVHFIARHADDEPRAVTSCGLQTSGTNVRYTASVSIVDCEACVSRYCHSDNDGECWWKSCPQLRDGEPTASGRHCPLDAGCDQR